MTKQLPYFKGGVVRLVDEQQLFHLQQQEAILEASVRRQEELETAATSSYDVDDLTND